MNVRQACSAFCFCCQCRCVRLRAAEARRDPIRRRTRSRHAAALRRVQAYVTGIRTYTACIQAELAAGRRRCSAGFAAGNMLIAATTAPSPRLGPCSRVQRANRPVRGPLSRGVHRRREARIASRRLACRNEVINDVAVVFVERDGSGQLNLLEDSCQRSRALRPVRRFRRTVGEFARGESPPIRAASAFAATISSSLTRP